MEPHRGLLNAFRHSGKSTVVGVFAACVLYYKPETRILILSAETGLASRMVSHIKNILENHPLCGDTLPAYLEKDKENCKVTVTHEPLPEEIQTGVAITKVIEYYAR